MNQTLSPSASPGRESTASTRRPQRVALVASSWHRDVVDQARDAISATRCGRRAEAVDSRPRDWGGERI